MKIVVITHHKTGTQLWAKIFSEIERRCKLKSILIKGASASQENLNLINDKWDICRFTHGIKDFKYLEALEKFDYRCVHSIRNPANIIISAAKYHKENHSEKWLTLKKKKYGNMSYQEKISSFENLQQQLIWEMNHISKLNIKNMMNLIKMNKSNFQNLDLDYLSFDQRMVEFNNLYYFLKLGQYKNVNSKTFKLKEWINIGLKNLLWNIENRPDNSSLKNTKKHITRETLKGLLDNRYKFEEESRNEFKKVFGNETYNYTFSD